MIRLRPLGPLRCLRPGEAGENQQVGGPDLEQEGAGVVGERADGGRCGGAEEAGAKGRVRLEPAEDRPALPEGDGEDDQHERQERGRDRPGEAARGEPQAPLGDVGEVAEAAGVEDRAGQVRVASAGQVDQGEQREGPQRRRDRQRAAPQRRPL